MSAPRLSFMTSLVIDCLKQLGGKGSIGEIHEIASTHPRFPHDIKQASQWAAIRHVLSTNSSDSRRWSGDADLFRSMGRGVWSLRQSGWMIPEDELDLDRTPAPTRWVDFVRQALADLGGEAATVAIWKKACRLRKEAGLSVPSSVAENVWWTLRVHSTGKDGQRQEVLFEQIDAHRWRLLPSASESGPVTTRSAYAEGEPRHG